MMKIAITLCVLAAALLVQPIGAMDAVEMYDDDMFDASQELFDDDAFASPAEFFDDDFIVTGDDLAVVRRNVTDDDVQSIGAVLDTVMISFAGDNQTIIDDADNQTISGGVTIPMPGDNQTMIEAGISNQTIGDTVTISAGVQNVSWVPSTSPSVAPSLAPSKSPTASPSRQPTVSPSGTPSTLPTVAPFSPQPVSPRPTDAPSRAPTDPPTDAPELPSSAPSRGPKSTPSPSMAPGPENSASPSMAPSKPAKNTPAPTTMIPTTAMPSMSIQASQSPSSGPSLRPSGGPSVAPSTTTPSFEFHSLPLEEDVSVTLFGLVSVLTEEEVDFVQVLTRDFIVESLEVPPSVTLSVDDLVLNQQTLGGSRRLQQQQDQDELQLDWTVSATATSRDANDLDELNFKALLQSTFLLRYRDYVSLLKTELQELQQIDGDDEEGRMSDRQLWILIGICITIAVGIIGIIIALLICRARGRKENAASARGVTRDASTVDASGTGVQDSPRVFNYDYEDDVGTEAEASVYTTNTTGKFNNHHASDWSCVSGIADNNANQSYMTDNEFEVSFGQLDDESLQL